MVGCQPLGPTSKSMTVYLAVLEQGLQSAITYIWVAAAEGSCFLL